MDNNNLKYFKNDKRAEGDCDYSGNYVNPCVGLYFYAGRYRELFQFQYVPKNRSYAPEYIRYYGHKVYIIEGDSLDPVA